MNRSAMFSIATNFDDDLIPMLAGLGVSEVYGSVTETPGGTGRPSQALPHVSLDRAASHIHLAHTHGLRFTLLLNAACTGNIEFLEQGRRGILHLLDFARQNSVETVTVTNPLLLAMVRRHAPGMAAKLSVHAEADTASRIQWWLAQGADIVTLPTRRNRDFPVLRQLGARFGDNVEILLNNLCLPCCPLDRYHGQTVAHCSTVSFGTVDPSLVLCNLHRLQHPHLFLASPWVRPEDLSHYEELGFTRFKLTDRCKSTAWLCRVARAYVTRKSPPDLMSILNCPSPDGEEDMAVQTPGRHMPRISISADCLEGFLAPFLAGRCVGDCPEEGCDHCRQYASAALAYHAPEIADGIARLRTLLNQWPTGFGGGTSSDGSLTS